MRFLRVLARRRIVRGAGLAIVALLLAWAIEEGRFDVEIVNRAVQRLRRDWSRGGIVAEALVAAVAQAMQAATKAARITRAQNREGVIDSLDLLDAERTLAETRAELADQDALVSSRQIDLFRALGGSWSAERETAS